MRIVIASGYFNPLHVGHIHYLQAAKDLGDFLAVVVNNDKQVGLKGSTPFMDESDRLEIINSLRDVDSAFISGSEDRTVIKDLEFCLSVWPRQYKSVNGTQVHNSYVFANGGDVTEDNCREAEFCMLNGIDLVYGVGGNTKEESSSNLLAKLGHKTSNAN
jgi:D-beta-D-heptose 7-phosphate kinase/D-beta-D-heptose 1-phosphate adenosyltransferase